MLCTDWFKIRFQVQSLARRMGWLWWAKSNWELSWRCVWKSISFGHLGWIGEGWLPEQIGICWEGGRGKRCWRAKNKTILSYFRWVSDPCCQRLTWTINFLVCGEMPLPSPSVSRFWFSPPFCRLSCRQHFPPLAHRFGKLASHSAPSPADGAEDPFSRIDSGMF